MLIGKLRNRGKYACDFIETFGKIMDGYFAHKKWMKEHGGEFRGKPASDERIHAFCLNYMNLAKSVEEKGLISPIEVFKSEGMIEIDGWHRLLIMKALGYKTIKYRMKEDAKLEL
jgi:hypothetical protein